MGKHFQITVLLQLITHLAFSQMETNNWLAGGDFSYTRAKSSGTAAVNSISNEVAINGSLGYFFVDKVAGGLQLSTSVNKVKYPNGMITNGRQIGLGPFMRYYFLPIGNEINILVEGAYSHAFFSTETTGNSKESHRVSSYAFFAGPVLFLNSSIGLEFLVGYLRAKTISVDAIGSNVRFRIGFQLYLERI